MIIGVHHVQVNVPTNALQAARAFYLDFLGFTEFERPKHFTTRGIWMRAGDFEMHVGLEDGVDRTTRAHVAYEVNDITAWRAKIADAGFTIKEEPLIEGYDRFQFRDPFGNNIELIARKAR